MNTAASFGSAGRASCRFGFQRVGCDRISLPRNPRTEDPTNNSVSGKCRMNGGTASPTRDPATRENALCDAARGESLRRGRLGAIPLRGCASRAGYPEIDRLLQSPVAKDWATNGGNLTPALFHAEQINTTMSSSSTGHGGPVSVVRDTAASIRRGHATGQGRDHVYGHRPMTMSLH